MNDDPYCTMKVSDIVIIVCMMIVLYFNLTSIPKQDYTCCNNPWHRPVTGGTLEKGLK